MVAIPAQQDRIAVVTGASSGLGRRIAATLGAAGAHVVLAVRNPTKGEAVAAPLRDTGAQVEVMTLDLGDLASVSRFAATFRERFERLDVLVNNAGIFANAPGATADGFGLEIGVNHLGHFALTGRLLVPLLASPGARVVTMSSGAAGNARLDLETFHQPSTGMYGPSKLANLLFALELQRRFARAGASAQSLAADPGPTRTEGVQGAIDGTKNPVVRALIGGVVSLMMRSPEQGIEPALVAATAPGAKGGEYYGPSGFMGFWGSAGSVPIPESASDEVLARGLWDRSVALTGVDYSGLEHRASSST
ncbi:MAG: SDR family NAD(P)-dependent oxidoreductase [Myxococcota bacterium]